VKKIELLSIKDVTKLLKLPKSTLYYLIQKGKFPKPLKLSDRKIAWKVTQIEEWLKQIEKRRSCRE